MALRGPGDGSVTRASALGEVAWDHVFFFPGGHSSLLKNPAFHNNLLYLLLETRSDPRSVEGIGDSALQLPLGSVVRSLH